MVEPSNPCIPTPCGLNSQCRVVGQQAVCSCLPNYIGRAPNCRPECTINQECPGNLACVNERCTDPCPGSCGFNAQCVVTNHSPHCQCQAGFTGDPFNGCNPIPVAPIEEERHPCNPSPCGANAECRERNGAGSCVCIPEYFGDPYTGCRPECVTNSDCPRDKACLNNKCKDPCPGICGINAECRVSNHVPSCFCLDGYTGNPSVSCHLPPPSMYFVLRTYNARDHHLKCSELFNIGFLQVKFCILLSYLPKVSALSDLNLHNYLTYQTNITKS